MFLAASGLAGLLPLLLILACPLMMIFMMKGMHSGGHDHGQAEPKQRERMSMDELKHERDALNEEIGRRAAQHVHPGGGTRRGAIR